MDTAAFFLQGIENLPNTNEISAQLMADSCEDISASKQQQQTHRSSSIGNAIILPASSANEDRETGTSIEISATVPRGKFNLSIHAHGIALKNKKNESVVVRKEDVLHVIAFPKPEDCRGVLKKVKGGGGLMIPGSMVLLVLRQEKSVGENIGVGFRNKQLEQICFQLPSYLTNEDTLPMEDFEKVWIDMLSSSFSLEGSIARVFNPLYHQFQSNHSCFTFKSEDGGTNTSSLNGGMPYVKCYYGFNDGVLYPLKEGLLFFKPPKFVHRSRMDSIACGRGSGGSRYVDLKVIVDSLPSDSSCDGSNEETNNTGKEVEFANIDRAELLVINRFINEVFIEALARDVAGNGDDGGTDNNGRTFSSRNESESGNNSDAKVFSAAPVRQRTQRAASKQARDATKAQLQTATNQMIAHDEDDDEDEDDVFSSGEMQSDSESNDEEGCDSDNTLCVQSSIDCSEIEDDETDSDDEEEILSKSVVKKARRS